MLKLWIGRREKEDDRYIGQPDFTFDEEIDKHCIDTDFGRRLIYACSGKARVINYVTLELPNGELLSPKELSSGTKNVFVMDNDPDSLCDLLWCGDNFFPFIAEIANHKDIEACTSRWLVPFDGCTHKNGILIMNTGKVVYNGKEFIDEVIGNRLDSIHNI